MSTLRSIIHSGSEKMEINGAQAEFNILTEKLLFLFYDSQPYECMKEMAELTYSQACCLIMPLSLQFQGRSREISGRPVNRACERAANTAILDYAFHHREWRHAAAEILAVLYARFRHLTDTLPEEHAGYVYIPVSMMVIPSWRLRFLALQLLYRAEGPAA